MLRCWSMIASVMVFLALSPPAHAERSEAAVGVSGGLLMPSVGSSSPTAFAMTTWGAGLSGQYGVTDDLDLRLSFAFSMFEGRTGNQSIQAPSGQRYEGNLQFNGAYYHPEFGVRYKLWAGYKLAPYIEAQIGYLWATYHGTKARYAIGTPIDDDFGDFAQGTITVAAGLAVDYRLFKAFFLGAAVRYVQPLREQYFQHYITAPITLSFYWM